MKEKNPYQIFNNYCLRTPLFPYSNYIKLIEKDEVLEEDFKQILKNAVFREALFLASPELLTQIKKWEVGDLNDVRKIERLQITILKYYTRISTRCTPFGLFASCGLGSFDSKTEIELGSIDDYKRITRFDTTFLNSLFQKLLKEESIKENVLFYPNTSIYKIGNHYRYVEYTIENKKRIYSLEGFQYSSYIELILKEAKKGKKISELANLIIDEEITFIEAKEFIDELIENQILVSELEITVTGSDYFTSLLERIEKIPESSTIYTQLKELQDKLAVLDTGINNSIADYQSIGVNAKKIVPELDTKFLFQTDSFSSFNQNTLNKHFQKQLKKALVLFNKMTAPSVNGNIEAFKRKFLKRFEQSEVQLYLVLDTETGIGYGDKRDNNNDLLATLITPSTKKRYEHVIWTDTDDILQEKLVKATKNNQYQINLTSEDFKDLSLNWDDLPDTFSSIIEAYKTQGEEQVFIKGVGGSSAVNLLGRFSYGDKDLLEYVNNILATEETINADKILAEIVHLPEARTGNILQRPSFRKYEIPYIGKSSVVNNYQIPIEDILISVKNNRIVLRSKKYNKEILPRLGNAHNYSTNSLPLYQFLCELQTQDIRSSIGFIWNSILKKQPFLPRVVFENLIFSKAQWKINVKEFKTFFKQENILSEIKKWQKKLMLPNYVELVDGDNKLLICLTNETSLKMLLHTIKNRKQFLLEEFLFSEDEFIKDTQGNSYCNQFVVSFYNDQKLEMTQNEH